MVLLLIPAISRQDSGTGSRLFEVNIWMWRYGRSFPRKVCGGSAFENQGVEELHF
jgi:hypothetical protein